ncbi:protein of unknown function [Xenorhabdus doucetiae]|uniref:Uncharacterized protein n=1 Tax=Xenorhabdus doucetiae TaxID=351671 RepID=A0A068QMF1_9GAMM|nr:protein of unknown function [Xenorhabdus doucetiae]
MLVIAVTSIFIARNLGYYAKGMLAHLHPLIERKQKCITHKYIEAKYYRQKRWVLVRSISWW